MICGHDYASHFSPIKYLEPGAEVVFTSVESLELPYIEPTAIEKMINNDYDLTIFTCSPGGQTRCAVRCVRQLKEYETYTTKPTISVNAADGRFFTSWFP